MPKLDRIVLINAAGFDYLEFPVGGHGQVIGVNGHGKSTLLRTILFFYLGSNEKSSYALRETKKDFVSYYLGDPPSYLIFEVARGNGQPSFHIAATRPSGRIHFQFVDAPYLKNYYLNGSFVQTLDAVLQRLSEARCAHDSVTSYEEFVRRLYGIAPSPYAVFRPAPRSSGQVSILPRIISGIFTVSQLVADKLKAVLTCGVSEDSLTTELDLLALKGQLENFRRVNRAVKTFIRFESDALQLVDVAEEFEAVKGERRRAIEDLVRMAKRLPARARELQEQQASLERERSQAAEQHQKEKSELESVIGELGKTIAVLDEKIRQGEEALKAYTSRQIKRKAAELETLPRLREDKRLADENYAALTTKYDNENQRKERMLGNLQQSWAELSRQSEQRRAEVERTLTQTLEQLNAERTSAFAALDEEQQRAKMSLAARQAGLDFSRGKLTEEFKAWADTREPDELRKTHRSLEEKQGKQRAEVGRLQGFRAELALQKEQRGRAREKIDQNAEAERSACQTRVNEAKAARDTTVEELQKSDGSLARFFQTNSLETWPKAAKTLSREILFHDASELEARLSSAGANSVWGVEISTEKLPMAADGYDRDALEAKRQELQRALAQAQDQLTAVQQRYIADVDTFEKQSNEAQAALQSKIDNSSELVRSLSSEAEHLENRMITLQSQFQAHKTEWRGKLETRDQELKANERQLRTDQTESESHFLSRRQRAEGDFSSRKAQLAKQRDERLEVIAGEEKDAMRKCDAERLHIERTFEASLAKQGVNEDLIRAARERANLADANITRVEGYAGEVLEFQGKKHEFIDPLDSLRPRLRTTKESLDAETERLVQINKRYQQEDGIFQERQNKLTGCCQALQSDEGAVKRFRCDKRFLLEWSLLEDKELEPAPFYRPRADCESLQMAESTHESRVEIEARGNKNARSFLNHFDAETLDRKVLGFSPIHDHFDWYMFVGAELRPFVNGRGIQGMRQIQTQEFDQLIRNICGKNADFQGGIRQVRQTAALVQENLEKNNFVDVLDSIELKVERIDNNLTRILTELESFAGLNFSPDKDLFGKRADKDQIERAIDTFARLVREIENYQDKQNCQDKRLRLTDYFDFLIRVHENGHDMGWKKSLDDIGSTGTDFLVKMLIYLSLIEVYRERAIDAKGGATVHCVLDETGILAPKYVRRILEYAQERGIVLITAGHAQQTVGFENWVRVRKRGQRFGGQTVLRKVLTCDPMP
jgi:hypothetical protein